MLLLQFAQIGSAVCAVLLILALLFLPLPRPLFGIVKVSSIVAVLTFTATLLFAGSHIDMTLAQYLEALRVAGGGSP